MPSHHPTRVLFPKTNILLCVLCASAVSLSQAGPLTPPVGPIAPTPGPEPRIAINAANTPGDANSLFKITQPGSYYLAGNITGVAARNGIDIAASNVTIDLGGFALIGVPTSLDAIATEGNRAAISIRNGTISAWGADGIDLITAGAGDAAVIENVTAVSNVSVGFRLSVATTLTNCTARLHSSTGIETGTQAVITGCSSSGNAGNGFFVGSGSTITQSAAWNNGFNGFTTAAGCTITKCSAYVNGSNGIFAGTDNTIAECTLASNGSDGIDANSNCTIRNCTSNVNEGDGIEASSNSLVADCVCAGNTLNGIEVFSNSTVRGNNCSTNGFGVGDGAGIRVATSDNRIEGNNCTDGDRGIDVDNSGNIITRNTCSGNTTNYDIVANNYYGSIIDRTGAVAAAVSGSAAVSTLGSSDPNANYSY